LLAHTLNLKLPNERNMKQLVSKILAISVLVASANAMAQEQKAYIGGSFGFERANIDCGGAPTCDRDGTSASVYGGYRFTPWFAGELRYLHTGPATLAGGGVSAEFKTDGFGLVAALSAPVGTSTKWMATSRLGIMHNKSVVDVSANGSSVSVSDRNAQPYLGIEFGYKVNQVVTGTFGWEFTRGKSNYSQGSVSVSETANVNALSAGVRFDF
jgi:OOP family OmpA-OmpF porin